MASGKQGLYVVVWEWENKQGRWRPYPPEVAHQLERAHSKNLRSVYLGDSDPTLKNYCVNISEMRQTCQVTGDIVHVRRSFYPQSSPAGQGAVWQWGGDSPGDWHVYDMCVQVIIEATWASGAQTLDMSQKFPGCPYIINFCNLTQMNKRSGFVRSIKRIQQAAYPVGKPPVTPGSQRPNQDRMGGARGGAPGPQQAMHSSNAGEGEPPRRRGSKSEDSDGGKPKNIFTKILGLTHHGTTNCRSGQTTSLGGGAGSAFTAPADTYAGCGTSGSGGAGASGGGRSSGCSGGSGGSDASNGSGGSYRNPPKPLPRTIPPPPVPRPRTNPPQTKQVPVRPPYPRPCGRSDAGFGSNHTIDSDCSSLASGRRPSVDTISTYLSLESCMVEDDPRDQERMDQDEESSRLVTCIQNSFQSIRPSHSRSSSRAHCTYFCFPHTLPMDFGMSSEPRVDKLINYDDDDSTDNYNDDDEVFSEDQEVSRVLGPAATLGLASDRSPPMSHSSHKEPFSQGSNVPHAHFVPITAGQPSSDLGLQVNGVKRKRTGEPAESGRSGSQYGSSLSSRGPITQEDKLLMQYTCPVASPPDEMCSICMCGLLEESDYSDAAHESAAGGDNDVVQLALCGHMFHLACLGQLASTCPQYLQCPNCKTIHGQKLGNQPPGNMEVKQIRRSLPGHPGSNTIQITYHIRDGMQGPEHPHPGRMYRAFNFPRTAYLPETEKGKKVLGLLKEAWQRGLIFTVGNSVTTGQRDVVTWNEIHHKTEWHDSTGHGYPDANYLDNVMMELALQGVTETTLV